VTVIADDGLLFELWKKQLWEKSYVWLTTVTLGLAGTVALWFLGMLVVNGFAWP
jgi:hypothetical protein